nr:hypothetical protein CFP56_22035 [Quercus suber]
MAGGLWPRPCTAPHSTTAMPRKSGGSEAPSETSARTSLRRLSSIASFQALNPFARRRSNNTTTDNNVSESTASLSSTTENAPQPSSDLSASTSNSTSHLLTYVDETALLPVQASLTRSSPVPPRQNPAERVPRSRTFSNLPIPARLYRNAPVASCKSNSRLPTSRVLPPTRLPSPPTTNRKYSGSNLASAEVHRQHVKNGMKRSDTEPLLLLHSDQRHGTPRMTAFKENISPGLPKHRPTKHKQSQGQHPSSCTSLSDLSDVSEPSSASKYTGLSDVSAFTRYNERCSQYSPNFPCGQKWHAPSGAPSATPKPLQVPPVQRWNSQPILSNLTNVRSPQHEIKQVRLMSERHPPTPPPPRTPAGMGAMLTARSQPSSTNRHVGQVTQISPSHRKVTFKPLISPSTDHHEVHKAEAASYWCGRFAALEDRYRNEELAASLRTQIHDRSSTDAAPPTGPNFWPRHESDQMHTPEMTTQRRRRAIEHLYKLCTTVEARDSFVQFQWQLAAAQHEPDLARPVQSDRTELGDGARFIHGVARKVTFMDRLLGRGGKIKVNADFRLEHAGALCEDVHDVAALRRACLLSSVAWHEAGTNTDRKTGRESEKWPRSVRLDWLLVKLTYLHRIGGHRDSYPLRIEPSGKGLHAVPWRLLPLGLRSRGGLLALGRQAGEEALHLIHASDEEPAVLGKLALENAEGLGVGDSLEVLVLAAEVLDEKAGRGVHAVALALPQADLVDDGGRQDRRAGLGVVRAQDRVRVRDEVADDLIGANARADGAQRRLLRQACRDEVRVARLQRGEERQDGDGQRGRGVGVQSVVGLEDDVPFLVGRCGGVGGDAAAGGLRRGRVGQCRRVGCQCGGEPRGVVVRFIVRRTVDETEVCQIV